MILTKPQRLLIQLLKMFGTLRIDQAEKLLKIDDETVIFDVAVKPIELGGRVQRIGDFIVLYRNPLKYDYIELLDIVLLLEPKKVSLIQRGSEPFAITFFKEREEKLWRYDICPVKYGLEAVISAQLEDINTSHRMLVFVLEKPEQQNGIEVDCEQCYVWKENGEYKFYKMEERLD